MKIAVIGAGPAGITAAYCLSKANKQVDVYEAESSVGGMAKTFKLWDCLVDLGPHRFFSNDKKVNQLWREVIGNDYMMVKRQTRIYYKNKFFDYPLKPINALTNLGIFEASNCVFSYLKEKAFNNSKNELITFEDWVKNRFGKRLYEIFFKTYSEKLWGIPCTELDSDFAAQRIKKFSLSEAIKNAVFKSNSKEHKTLVDEFAYPLYGSGMTYEKMAEFIRSKGNNIYLNTKVKKITNNGYSIKSITLESGDKVDYDFVISTMPLTIMVSQLNDAPEIVYENCKKLNYRNTIIVYLKVEHTNLFTDNWLYIHSRDVLCGRISNFRNWVPTLYPKDCNYTIIAMEYWCYDHDEIWNLHDKELIDLAKKDLITTKLNKNAKISDGYVVKLHRSYPVYSINYKNLLSPIQNYIQKFDNLYAIGRYGAFKYNNQDHSIFMGMMAANNIINNNNFNLWEINTDYDSYQEKVKISETGLQ